MHKVMIEMILMILIINSRSRCIHQKACNRQIPCPQRTTAKKNMIQNKNKNKNKNKNNDDSNNE